MDVLKIKGKREMLRTVNQRKCSLFTLGGNKNIKNLSSTNY